MTDCSLYVHLPFCKSRCFYCDFCTQVVLPVPCGPYRQALEREWRERRIAVLGAQTPSLYLGGGTPSLWPASELAALIAYLSPPSGAEITVEVNPGDATREWFDEMARAGVTRFSIGVQSVDNARLAFLQRRHDAAAARVAVDFARQTGCSVGADLIYGTPAQSPDEARREALDIVSWGVDHVSAYELTVAASTPLGRAVHDGSIELPDDEAMADLWTAIGDALAGAGLAQYEVSNFSRAGHRSRHNMHYWSGGFYVGLGAGAHGFVPRQDRTNVRYANTPDVAAYLLGSSASEACGDSAVPWCEESRELIDARTSALEKIMLGLRTKDGVPLEALSSEQDCATAEAWRREAQGAVLAGLAELQNGFLRPTRRGLLLADGLALRFF